MSKKVLVREDVPKMYMTLEDAAKDLGMSVSGVSLGVRDGRLGLRWVDRVFAVRKKCEDWRVCVLNSRNVAYLPVSQVGNRILVRDVVEVKELTAIWYYEGSDSI